MCGSSSFQINETWTQIESVDLAWKAETLGSSRYEFSHSHNYLDLDRRNSVLISLAQHS